MTRRQGPTPGGKGAVLLGGDRVRYSGGRVAGRRPSHRTPRDARPAPDDEGTGLLQVAAGGLAPDPGGRHLGCEGVLVGRSRVRPIRGSAGNRFGRAGILAAPWGPLADSAPLRAPARAARRGGFRTELRLRAVAPQRRQSGARRRHAPGRAVRVHHLPDPRRGMRRRPSPSETSSEVRRGEHHRIAGRIGFRSRSGHWARAASGRPGTARTKVAAELPAEPADTAGHRGRVHDKKVRCRRERHRNRQPDSAKGGHLTMMSCTHRGHPRCIVPDAVLV